jgi:ribosomal protein S6
MDDIGTRTLAYPIKKKTEGHYVLFEIDGSGQEIMELERRMRVNDMINAVHHSPHRRRPQESGQDASESVKSVHSQRAKFPRN